ncbi:MAG: hypothetical protein OXB94_04770 [Nitrospira sp.]|nr:hypothetical protein [Nitrospira sp.]
MLNESEFREEYGFTKDTVISFDGSEASFQSSSLFDAIRKVLAGVPTEKVLDTKGRKWKLENISEKGVLPSLSISCGDRRLRLPNFAVFSPDSSIRLRSLDEAISDVNLPGNVSDPWRNIFAERALENDEVRAFHSEVFDTPVTKMRFISSEILRGQINISSLIPPSRRYFERLVGAYDGSTSIAEYAACSGSMLFKQLSAWRPYDGFLFSLFLSSHSSMTAEINVDQLDREDLVRAFAFLEKHGDRLSQLGAIEVGLRVLPSRPELEQALNRLIEQIRDDDVEGQASSLKLFSALFCLVDGELARIRLLSTEPPFYRRLAALSQAALIHRQIVNSDVDIDHFSEWAFSNHGWQHYLQSLADMRLEPRWNPNLAMASQMKAEFFGRIMISSKNYEQNLTDSQISDLVLTNKTGSLQSLSDFFDPYLPGPLEGGEEAKNILPAEFEETIEAQLRAEQIAPSSFIALVNSALLFRIGADKAELAAKGLKLARYRLLNIESKPELLAILNGLATVAAVSRSLTLADELRILVRKYRHDAEFSLAISEAIEICLVAAASRTDLNAWREFVGDWLTELAFSDLSGNDGEVLYSYVRCMCDLIPELWVSCGRAEAALTAYNESLPK